MPSETPTLIRRLPSKRSISTVLSAAMIIPSAAAISSSVRTFFAPPEPFVSALSGIPSFVPAFSSASAAIYVCAIPVGHAVTANIRYPAFTGSLFASPSGYFSFSISSMTFKNSALSEASIKRCLNPSSMSIVMSLESTSRCTSPPSLGAAIMNSSLEGLLSGAS